MQNQTKHTNPRRRQDERGIPPPGFFASIRVETDCDSSARYAVTLTDTNMTRVKSLKKPSDRRARFSDFQVVMSTEARQRSLWEERKMAALER